MRMRNQLPLTGITIIGSLVLSPKLRAQEWIAPAPGLSDTAHCSECDPGEWRLIVERVVDPGDYVYVPDPPCNDASLTAQRGEIARALADYALPGLGQAAGPLIDALNDNAATWFKQNVQGSVGEFLSSYTKPVAECQIVAGIIPKDATVTGVKYWADDGIAHQQTCGPDANGDIICGIGWSKFYPAYREDRAGGTAVSAVFANWSNNRQRGATLGIYFRPVPREGTDPHTQVSGLF